MDQNSDDAIVASLMLLLDGKALDEAGKLLVRALKPRSAQTKFVCTKCGSDNLSWQSNCYWSDAHQDFVVDDWDNCWCHSCESRTHDEQVHIDWVKPEEKDELKPSGDP
jgi:hypothetical protein